MFKIRLFLFSLIIVFGCYGCCRLADFLPKGHDIQGAGFPNGIWTNVTPALLPVPRDFHALCYDSSNQVVVLFGGRTNQYCYVNDTWVYRPGLNVWSNMNPGVSPSIRHRHAMCYDSFNRKVILFGGDDDWYSNDTWAYDYALNTWSNMNPASPPPGRYYHSVCFDSVNHKVILFGGAGGGQFDDTWTYDYALNTWSNMNPPTHPATRYLHSMSYDPDRQRVVLFGGRDNFTYYSDTWAYNYALNNWENLGPATNPSARACHSMCYDNYNKKTVLFGGWDESTGLNDLWIYDFASNEWESVNQPISPAGRLEHTVCFDSANNLVILYGGWTNNLSSFGYSSDTWALSIR